MTFSIVVPVYNVLPVYLKECVESILSQSFSDFEILLVDDGSTDKSGELCDSLALKDSRIKVIHKENGGVSSARNEGISLVSGKWLLFCDADDTLQQNCLESIHQTIAQHQYDFYKFHYSNLKEDGTCQEIPYSLPTQVFSADDYLKLLLRHQVVGSCWGCVYRTDYVKRISFNTELHIGEDSLFVMNYLLLISCNVYVSSSTIYNYRDNPASVSKNWKKICSEIDAVKVQTESLLKNYSALEKFRVEYNTFVVQNLVYTHLWKRRVPNKDNQNFLIANGDDCCEGDVDEVMKKYIHYLKKNRIFGNAFLMAYYAKTGLFSFIAAKCRLMIH